jgi:hypothetical protein
MKALFGCLMCFVLTSSQAFALSGGPPYPSATNIAGTYAGVMSPRDAGRQNCALNSLGIFSLVAPPAGLSEGQFVMFAQGRVFSGTIQAVADPGKSTIKGILDATFNFTVHFFCGDPIHCPADPLLGCAGSQGCDVDVTADAKGSMNTTINSASSSSFGIGSRLNGKAVLKISQGQVDSGTLEPIFTCKIRLNVDGFKQSNG